MEISSCTGLCPVAQLVAKAQCTSGRRVFRGSLLQRSRCDLHRHPCDRIRPVMISVRAQSCRPGPSAAVSSSLVSFCCSGPGHILILRRLGLPGSRREPSLSCRCSEQSTATLLAIQHLQAGEALDVSSISGMDADEMPLRSTGRGQRIRFQATRLRRADGGCETARDQAQCTILLDCRSDNVLYSYRRASPDFDVTVSR